MIDHDLMKGRAVNNHTPGTWDWVPCKGCGFYADIWADGIRIALVDLRPKGKRKEQPANANLIAAAPDLLKVAVRFERLLVKMGLPIDGKGNKELSLVRDAIAKATGSNDPPDVA